MVAESLYMTPEWLPDTSKCISGFSSNHLVIRLPFPPNVQL